MTTHLYLGCFPLIALNTLVILVGVRMPEILTWAGFTVSESTADLVSIAWMALTASSLLFSFARTTPK